MILTGKALEDFLVKIYYTEDTNQASDESCIRKVIFHANKWLEKQDERFINTLIIDWFDSVGIYINVQNISKGVWYEYTIDNDYVNTIDFSENKCNTRKEAIKQAITKANNIYNELNE